MLSIYIWMMLVMNAFCSISIKVEPSAVVIGKSDIDIRCIVDGTNLKSILSITLNRSKKTIVEIRDTGDIWKDAAFQNKTDITVSGSVSSIKSSYLSLEISKTAVRYQDIGSYQCSLATFYSNDGLKTNESQIVNISVCHETTTDFTTSVSTEPFTSEKHSKMYTEQKQTEQFTEGRNSKIYTNQDLLYMYRAVMVPIGSFITCIFACVIIREIRLHYFVSN